MGELLFGLIMVLTFTLGAGLELGEREETRDLLIAALGCNTAWGIIDAALYLIARLSERGRTYRLVRAIQTTPSRAEALALIDRELAARLPPVVATRFGQRSTRMSSNACGEGRSSPTA